MDTKDMTFVQQEIDGAYINSLVRLVNACNLMGVELDKVSFYQNGFRVTFKGYDGADAICHDGSYGSPCYMARYNGKGHDNDWSRYGDWETIGFPWDYDDVSCHSAEELASYIALLNSGKNIWEKDDDKE